MKCLPFLFILCVPCRDGARSVCTQYLVAERSRSANPFFSSFVYVVETSRAPSVRSIWSLCVAEVFCVIPSGFIIIVAFCHGLTPVSVLFSPLQG